VTIEYSPPRCSSTFPATVEVSEWERGILTRLGGANSGSACCLGAANNPYYLAFVKLERLSLRTAQR